MFTSRMPTSRIRVPNASAATATDISVPGCNSSTMESGTCTARFRGGLAPSFEDRPRWLQDSTWRLCASVSSEKFDGLAAHHPRKLAGHLEGGGGGGEFSVMGVLRAVRAKSGSRPRDGRLLCPACRGCVSWCSAARRARNRARGAPSRLLGAIGARARGSLSVRIVRAQVRFFGSGRRTDAEKELAG
jgi:hypothetical protein